MKKFLAIAILTLATLPAFAQHGYNGHWERHGGGWGWVPFIGGAVAGAVIYDIYNRPVVVQQPPIVVQQPPVTVLQQPPAGYHWQQMQDPQTKEMKFVLVPN
jgi:hypothetical protein